jgi:hypothetical protein
MAASDVESTALAPAPVSFEGTACAGPQVLRSPVSGQPCVYWRVRITQRLTSRSQLVHEIASEEAFEVAFRNAARHAEDGVPAPRVRLDPANAQIDAPPVLHREGTPGAEAAAQYFGLAGPLQVEETLVRVGEALSADGVIEDLDGALGAAPGRGTSRGPELVDALVVVESKSLGPALLPWALGTAAALMGGMGLATYAAVRTHLLQLPPANAIRLPRMPSAPSFQPLAVPRPRFP